MHPNKNLLNSEIIEVILGCHTLHHLDQLGRCLGETYGTVKVKVFKIFSLILNLIEFGLIIIKSRTIIFTGLI